MEAIVKAKRLGGSIAVIVPREIIAHERIMPNDVLKIKVTKSANLGFLKGRWKEVKKSTRQIMREIDEGEDE